MRDIKKEMATAQSDADFAKESEQYYKEQATRLLDMDAYTAAANAAELAGKHRDEYQKNRILYMQLLIKSTDKLLKSIEV